MVFKKHHSGKKKRKIPDDEFDKKGDAKQFEFDGRLRSDQKINNPGSILEVILNLVDDERQNENQIYNNKLEKSLRVKFFRKQNTQKVKDKNNQPLIVKLKRHVRRDRSVDKMIFFFFE